MISVIQAIILSIVQGITEWFPISSSGHLAIIQNLFGEVDLSYDIFLHFASILAIIVIFWKDILELIDLRKKKNLKYVFFLIIATIPAALIGVFFNDFIRTTFSNMIFLSVFFIFSGLLVYSTKFVKEKNTKITWIDSLIVGCFQAIAIFPGISRSGATISGGLFRGLDKQETIKFSFFLAIIIIFAGSLTEATNISNINYFILIISFITTFLVSLFAIKVLLKIIKNGNFWKFGIYNLILGILILILSLI